MDKINEWSYCVCITLIASVIFSLLLPKGSAGKTGRLVITVFIIISLTLPLKSGAFDFDFSGSGFYEQSENNLKEASYSDIIAANIKNTLSSNGIDGSGVNVDASVSGDEITVERVRIFVPDDCDKEKVKELVFDSLGINAEVYFLGE